MIKLQLELKGSQEKKSFLAFMFWQIMFSSECECGEKTANQKQFNPTMELKLHHPCLNATHF